MGTIPYMSPEQACDAKTADARSDIYSLGCTLHFLLTGRPPYAAKTWAELFLAHRHEPIPSLKAARRSVPDHLEKLFVRMLAKNPADRPQTMAAVIASTEIAMDQARARPSPSRTIPVHCPDEDIIAPFVSIEDLDIEVAIPTPPKVSYYPRIRLSNGPSNLMPLLRYSRIAVVTAVSAILIIEGIIELIRLVVG